MTEMGMSFVAFDVWDVDSRKKIGSITLPASPHPGDQIHFNDQIYLVNYTLWLPWVVERGSDGKPYLQRAGIPGLFVRKP